MLQGLLWLYSPSYWPIDGLNVTWSATNDATDHMVKMTDGVGWVYENSESWGARSFAALLVFGSINTGATAGPGLIEGNIIVDGSEGYAIRAYKLTGTNNVFRDNVFGFFDFLQYGDDGYNLVTDGGGNLHPLDPKFDSTVCEGFHPQDPTGQAYGRYGR